MAALTKNVLRRAENREGNSRKVLAAASTRIYQGGLTFRAASGYSSPTAGGAPFQGVSTEELNNSSGANGDLSGELWEGGAFELEGSGFTQADVHKKVYAVDDNTVSLTSTANSYIGTIVEFISATKVIVKLDVQVP